MVNRSRKGHAVSEPLRSAQRPGSHVPRQANAVPAALRGPVPERQDVGGDRHGEESPVGRDFRGGTRGVAEGNGGE